MGGELSDVQYSEECVHTNILKSILVENIDVKENFKGECDNDMKCITYSETSNDCPQRNIITNRKCLQT
jgi:hypothetical protein